MQKLGLPTLKEGHDCKACNLAKWNRPHFKPSNRERSSVIFEHIHSDVLVPNYPTGDGELYAIHFTCDCILLTKVYLMKKKSDTLNCFKKFVNFCKSEGYAIRILQCDNDGPYHGQDLIDFCA